MNEYKEKLQKKMDEFVKLVYRMTKKFPKEEIYGITSQLRRSSLSVVLNYIEGFARRKKAVQLNFLEISYGSLKEAEYILKLSFYERYLNQLDYKHSTKLANEIGAMLWTEITQLDKSIKNS